MLATDMRHCARSLKAIGPESKVHVAPLPAPKFLSPTCLILEIPVYLLIFNSEMKIYSINFSDIFFSQKMRAQDCAGFYINAYKIPNAVNMPFTQNASSWKF